MDYLNAPWRSEYFSQKIDGCVFCHIVNNKNEDEALKVLFRDKNCFGVMNKYPYSPGHFMIIPNVHTNAIETLDSETWQEISLHVRNGVRLLKEHMNAPGVNIGMNLGVCGGAGIAEHVHYHLVPRWSRDTNFITTIGDTRVNGVDFDVIYKKIKEAIPHYLALGQN